MLNQRLGKAGTNNLPKSERHVAKPSGVLGNIGFLSDEVKNRKNRASSRNYNTHIQKSESRGRLGLAVVPATRNIDKGTLSKGMRPLAVVERMKAFLL